MLKRARLNPLVNNLMMSRAPLVNGRDDDGNGGPMDLRPIPQPLRLLGLRDHHIHTCLRLYSSSFRAVRAASAGTVTAISPIRS
jgi:hypothetical protein